MGITVGFRDVGDVANTGGSVNYKVSIWKWDAILNIKHQYDTSYHQSRLPCRLGSDRGQCYWFRWRLRSNWRDRASGGSFRGWFLSGGFCGRLGSSYRWFCGRFGSTWVPCGWPGSARFPCGPPAVTEKGKWCYGLLEMKHEWDTEDIQNNIFLSSYFVGRFVGLFVWRKVGDKDGESVGTSVGWYVVIVGCLLLSEV